MAGLLLTHLNYENRRNVNIFLYLGHEFALFLFVFQIPQVTSLQKKKRLLSVWDSRWTRRIRLADSECYSPNKKYHVTCCCRLYSSRYC